MGTVGTGEGEDRTQLGLPEGRGHLVICTSYTAAEAVVLFSRVHQGATGSLTTGTHSPLLLQESLQNLTVKDISIELLRKTKHKT